MGANSSNTEVGTLAEARSLAAYTPTANATPAAVGDALEEKDEQAVLDAFEAFYEEEQKVHYTDPDKSVQFVDAHTDGRAQAQQVHASAGSFGEKYIMGRLLGMGSFGYVVSAQRDGAQQIRNEMVEQDKQQRSKAQRKVHADKRLETSLFTFAAKVFKKVNKNNVEGRTGPKMADVKFMFGSSNAEGVMRPVDAKDTFLEMQREIKLQWKLTRSDAAANNRSLMRLEEVFETKEALYVVMPRAHASLADVIKRAGWYIQWKSIGREPEEFPVELASLADAKFITAKIADGLQYMHGQGIGHLDLKPANVVIDLDGVPKIIDFGKALDQTDESHSNKWTTCRTTYLYAAPEALEANTSFGLEVDVWSLGCIAYELLYWRLMIELAVAKEHDALLAPPPPPKKKKKKNKGQALSPQEEAAAQKARQEAPRYAYVGNAYEIKAAQGDGELVVYFKWVNVEDAAVRQRLDKAIDAVTDRLPGNEKRDARLFLKGTLAPVPTEDEAKVPDPDPRERLAIDRVVAHDWLDGVLQAPGHSWAGKSRQDLEIDLVATDKNPDRGNPLGGFTFQAGYDDDGGAPLRGGDEYSDEDWSSEEEEDSDYEYGRRGRRRAPRRSDGPHPRHRPPVPVHVQPAVKRCNDRHPFLASKLDHDHPVMKKNRWLREEQARLRGRLYRVSKCIDELEEVLRTAARL